MTALREFFDRLDAAEPWALFWSAVVWLLCAWFAWAVVRVGASAEGQGRRVARQDERDMVIRTRATRSQGSVEMISKNRRGA